MLMFKSGIEPQTNLVLFEGVTVCEESALTTKLLKDLTRAECIILLNNLGCINAAASLGAFMIDGGDLSNVADLRQLTNLGLKFTELHAVRIVSRIKEFQQGGVPVEYLVANTLAPNVAADTDQLTGAFVRMSFDEMLTSNIDSSPVKALARDLNVRPQDLTLKFLQETFAKMRGQIRQQNYSTQDECDVGSKLLTDLNKSGEDGVVAVETLVLHPVAEVSPRTILFVPGTFGGSDEDQLVNAPLHQHLVTCVAPQHKLLLTMKRSKFLDCKGREQRSDMVFLAGFTEEWPFVVTMHQGKVNLTTQRNEALGQARRRAEAILLAQPWRTFVIIPVYDLESIFFFKLTREFVNSFSDPEAFLEQQGNTDKYRCRAGYFRLVEYLQHPALLGYVDCNVRLTMIDERKVDSDVVCARSSRKAVFLLMDDTITAQNEEGISVAKVFEDKSEAESELRQLQKLQHLGRGVPTIQLQNIVACQVEVNSAPENWYCYIVKPYCCVLTPSVASPMHFSLCAQLILDAAENAGLVCNDISPDNILLDTNSNEIIIFDWGLATEPGHRIGKSGKDMFIPPISRLADGSVDPNRVSSVRNDLYALLLVAVCCAVGDVPWACCKTARETRDAMLDACGLGETGALRKNETWSYLLEVAEALSHRIVEGSKVEGKYRGIGSWSPGRVTKDHGGGTFDICYDDRKNEKKVTNDMLRLVVSDHDIVTAFGNFEMSQK